MKDGIMRMTQLTTAGFEDGRGPQGMECWQPLKVRKCNKMDSAPRAFTKKHSPANNMILAH